MFSRATIRLGIGPHSSWFCCRIRSSLLLVWKNDLEEYGKLRLMTVHGAVIDQRATARLGRVDPATDSAISRTDGRRGLRSLQAGQQMLAGLPADRLICRRLLAPFIGDDDSRERSSEPIDQLSLHFASHLNHRRCFLPLDRTPTDHQAHT